jgi:DNA-binding NtrC family response regulator
MMSNEPSESSYGARRVAAPGIPVAAATLAFMVEKQGSPSILVIDDDPAMRQVLSDVLAGRGYRVVEASNGRDGIEVVESERVDAVILDKEMPGMSGFDVLSFFRHRRPGLPIIFVTAFGGREDAEESRKRGAWFFLEKPFRMSTVVEAVQAVLEKPGA